MKVKIFAVDQSTGEETCTDVVTVNRAIPRGVSIEALIERHGLGKTQVSDRN